MKYINYKEKAKIVIYHNGKILVLQKLSEKLKFVLPGGFIKKSEEPLKCLLREVEEETNIALNSKNIKYIDTIDAVGKKNKYLKKHYYKYKYNNELFVNNEIWKFSNVKWENYSVALKYMIESDKLIIKHLFKKE